MPEKLNLPESEVSRRILRFCQVLRRYCRCRCLSSLELCFVCLYEILFLLANNGRKGPQNMTNIYSLLKLDGESSGWVHDLARLRHSIAHCTLENDEDVLMFLNSLEWDKVRCSLVYAFPVEIVELLTAVYSTATAAPLALSAMNLE